jgi:hypothetical protein
MESSFLNIYLTTDTLLPVALFGAEAWWTGPSRQSINDPNKNASTGTEGLVSKLDRVFRTAARAVLPVWKTTSIPILHRESGIPPTSVALAQVRIRTAARYVCLDRNHPLSRRIDKKPPARLPMTRLQRTANLAGRTIRPTMFVRKNPAILPGRDLRGNPKTKAAEKHLELIDRLPNNAILA